jgi:hypothetical protein
MNLRIAINGLQIASLLLKSPHFFTNIGGMRICLNGMRLAKPKSPIKNNYEKHPNHHGVTNYCQRHLCEGGRGVFSGVPDAGHCHLFQNDGN